MRHICLVVRSHTHTHTHARRLRCIVERGDRRADCGALSVLLLWLLLLLLVMVLVLLFTICRLYHFVRFALVFLLAIMCKGNGMWANFSMLFFFFFCFSSHDFFLFFVLSRVFTFISQAFFLSLLYTRCALWGI